MTIHRRIRTDLIETLTPRELQVFRLTGEGLTARQIGRQLGIARSTVEVHQHNMKRKLRVPNGTQLLRLACLWEFVYGERFQVPRPSAARNLARPCVARAGDSFTRGGER